MSFPLGMVVVWFKLLMMRCTPWFCCLRLRAAWCTKMGETANVEQTASDAEC